jgi:hypothetical protein
MFKRKNAEGIRTIQEAFNCCGFVNSHDQAWPFPDKTHDQHACETAFGRTNGCFEPWRREEQRVAGIMMAVVGLVFVWQVCAIVRPIYRSSSNVGYQFAIIATPTRRESWLHRVLPDRVSRLIADEENGGPGSPRRAIDYLPNFNHYRDNVAGEVEEDGDSTPRRAIEEGVQPGGTGLLRPNREQEHPSSTVENEWAHN